MVLLKPRDFRHTRILRHVVGIPLHQAIAENAEGIESGVEQRQQRSETQQ